MRLTPEQRAAVQARDGELLLAAGAGSGKTAVIVERFVEAVRVDGVAVDAILAITFTDKAAAELAQRIRERFRGLDDDAHARETQTAAISTIHGFCARLLRAHAPLAGLDPRFEVLDQAAAERLARAAFEQALEDVVGARGDDAIELIAACDVARLRAAILDVQDALRSRGVEAPSLPVPAAAPDVTAALAGLREAGRAAAAELAGAAKPGKRVAQALAALARCAEPGESAVAIEALAIPSEGAAKALAGDRCGRYRAALAAYEQARADARAVGAVGVLDALLRAHGRRYAAAKLARSALDYADLELGARRLLADHADVRDRVAQRFAHLMVDEFQDCNPLQLELLGLIERGNLFTVGDERQAIYGFRHADVRLFRDRRAALAPSGATATLATSFRAVPELVHAIDLAFDEVFEDGFVALRPGRDDAARPDPPVELLVVDRDGFNGAEPPAEATAWRDAEARLLAGRVRELIDAGDHAARDIVVLLRALTDIDVYAGALEQAGVPTYVVGGRGYWAARPVADLLAHLRVLANPRDELALYEVLASPLVGASSGALLVLAHAARAQGRDVWWTLERALGGGDPEGGWAGGLAADDRARLERWGMWLRAERAGAPRRSLEALIDRALQATGYDLAILAMPGGERRLANVRKLMRMARAYEAAEGAQLRGFVDYATDQADDTLAPPREGEAPIEGEGLDAVRLMSIHRAKGLEFPVVCLADLGRAPRDDGRSLIRVDGDRIGVKLPGDVPALDWRAIGARADAAADAEERRLVYVAMTRAQERLIVTGAAKLAAWPADRHGAAPIAWVGPALVPEIARRAAAGAGGGVERRERGGWRARVRWACHTPDGAVAAEAAEAPPTAVAAAPPVAAVPAGDAIPTQAPLPAASPDHLSYSSLEDYRRCGYRFYLERRLGLARVDEPAPAAAAAAAEAVSPRARGTIVHALLERLDFARPRTPAREAVDAAAQVAGARLHDVEAAEIADLVARFGASALCRRLAGAGAAEREREFAFWLDAPAGDGVLVTGVLDAIARERKGRMLVVDYKSDRLDGADPEALVARDYATQRLVYALAALRAGAPEVQVVHCFLERPDEPASARFAAAYVPELSARLAALAAGVLAGEFGVSPTPHRELCHGCPGRAALCSWEPEMTGRPAPTAG